MKYTIEELKIKMNIIHKNKYEYNFNNYKNVNSKILIKCDKHGIFSQRVCDHLKGSGCYLCGIIKSTNKKRNNLSDLIKKSNIIHDNKYDYSLIKNYKNMHEKIYIKCNKHGIFETTFHNHVNKKRGCKECSVDKRRYNENIFIKKSNIVHDNKYDYSLVKYKTSKEKVDIICNIHGIFKQSPNYHLLGQGCPKCKTSKGEKDIINYLKEKNIKYDYQKKFEDLRYKRNLIFDFYLPELNTCIEYDGEQHYNIIEKWGGKRGLSERKMKDKMKDNYCIKNNIKMIRIRYDEDIIKKLYNLI